MVSLYSTIKMMHGPINIRCLYKLLEFKHCMLCIPVCTIESHYILYCSLLKFIDLINLSQRPLPDNTQHSQKTDKHPCHGGIRTHNLNRRAAADLRLIELAATGTGHRQTIENMQDSVLADRPDEVTQAYNDAQKSMFTTCFGIPASLRDWCNTKWTITSAGAVPRNFTVHKDT